MTHGSLFSGIGGFDLAAQWMGWDNVFQCEIDPFCQKVLQKNFPNVPLHHNIFEFDATPYKGKVDIITGGFPCQPFSIAGNRNGTSDDRYLWLQMLRVIRDVQPSYVIAENVPGLLTIEDGVAFEQVCLDLEGEGYHVQAFNIPACAVNAPHTRKRIWFIAYPCIERCNNGIGNRQKRHVQNDKGFTPQDKPQRERGQRGTCKACQNNDVGHPDRQRCQECITTTQSSQTGFTSWANNTRFLNGWDKFPSQPMLCGGVDGLPHRVDRVKSLGNAIVPQVAYKLFLAIQSYEKTH